MNGLPPTVGSRGGRSSVAIVASVFGSITTIWGRSRPTQTVTMRPLELNVTDAQSRAKKVDRRCGSRPSGPERRVVSVCQASSCRLLDPLGAMNGCCGGGGAWIGLGVAGAPK